jgi:predicted AlkP superfamily phosphohydrolase/phosphomutase
MKKALMIGLDGATYSILGPMMDAGAMPFLRQFIAEGVHGELMSTRNPLTPPAWTSMITGRSPNAHGIHDFLRPAMTDDGRVFLKINDSRDVRSETIWSIASRLGSRATALNFYGMSPPPKIEGHVIGGFVPWKHLRSAMHPTTLFDTVKGLSNVDYRDLGMDIGEEKKAVQGLLEGEHEDWIRLQGDRDTAWSEVCCHLLRTEPSALTGLVLDGPDKLQHLFWRFIDPALLPEQPDEWFAHIRSMCIDFYRKLDANVRNLVDAAGADADVMITSDHGFGITTEIVYVNEWLARNGYLKWAEGAESDDTGKLTANKYKDHLATIDWPNTVAFCPTPSSNAIYIRKAGGSGKGVKDGEYLDFVTRLRQQLLDFRDPRDGEPVFVAVDANKLEGKPYHEPSPDLTVHLRDCGFVSILKSHEVVSPREHPDGTHRPAGVIIGRGPSFKSGERVEALDLLDVAPLLLYCIGLPIPEDLEGRLPEEMLAADRLDERPAETAGVTEKAEGSDDADREVTPEEKEALMNQLKLLGYMD